jgi:hypothetical protein
LIHELRNALQDDDENSIVVYKIETVNRSYDIGISRNRISQSWQSCTDRGYLYCESKFQNKSELSNHIEKIHLGNGLFEGDMIWKLSKTN